MMKKVTKRAPHFFVARWISADRCFQSSLLKGPSRERRYQEDYQQFQISTAKFLFFSFFVFRVCFFRRGQCPIQFEASLRKDPSHKRRQGCSAACRLTSRAASQVGWSFLRQISLQASGKINFFPVRPPHFLLFFLPSPFFPGANRMERNGEGPSLFL